MPLDEDLRSVAAVVVAYRPQADPMRLLITRLAAQVGSIFVVDNGGAAAFALPPAATLVTRPGNTGVGAAQNAGARAAWAAGARWVLLLDQDSLPAPDMVAELLRVWRSAGSAGLVVGAVGPAVIDPAGRHEGFVRFRDGRYRGLTAAPGDDWIECDMLIASGSLIAAEAWAAVGGMDEGLFIDKVDTEWCLRAAAGGWTLLGAPRARLHHQLGQGTARLWWFGWRELPLHRPFRYYYMVRNGLLVSRLPHASAAWRRADRRQRLSLVLYFGVMARGRAQALRAMWRGWIDGLRGTTGPSLLP